MNSMALIHEKYRAVAATLSEGLRRELQEAIRLQRCEHDHDFSALATTIIEDLETLTEKYKSLLQSLYAAPTISETEVNAAIQVLLKQLPANYPPATFKSTTTGYWLEIDHTIIFRDASGEDAIKHTQNYVNAREGHPDLPIGVIYGIYD
jgi:hypothetical protein